MKTFITDDFLLNGKVAQELYHNYAVSMPIVDFHNHLPTQQIAEDGNFQTITQAWLGGDHYKWRAMRSFGIDEQYVTGNADDYEKFEQWAKLVPYTMRNPLYHWTHLELLRYFNIDELLNEKSAKKIYEECNRLLNSSDFSIRNLLRKAKVEVLCTTDDPIDSLEYHLQLKNRFEIKVLPTWRPDKSMAFENRIAFLSYIEKLGEIAEVEISTYQRLLDALQVRHDYFAGVGCKVADHGLEEFYSADYTQHEVDAIFLKLIQNKEVTIEEGLKYKSALLHDLACMNASKNWVQQFHFGVLRNNNSRLFAQLGADTGFDSIGDFSHGRKMQRFLDRLDLKNALAKTILYNINPRDNELISTMIGNFNDGSVRGKMQYGSGWWFLDQKDGIEKQINALSNLALLSCFVGMLTDSRSFLSFPRHEYFRRILCNILGNEVESGMLPNDIPFIGKMVQDICYNNSKEYFGF
jgi:glucuronate isomerase